MPAKGFPLVIPAKAGIQFDLASLRARLPLACGERVTFEQGFRAAALRGLLLALPKSNQKARRPTRCCTMPWASRLRRGSLDVHPCTFAHARASCARPYGHSPPQPAMLGTAKGAIFRTNPSILGLRLSTRELEDRSKATPHCFALDPGPPLPRRGHGGIVREDAHDARPFANGQGCPSSEPRCALAYSERAERRARHRGRPLFGYFLLAGEEKVTRSPQASGSSAFEHGKSQRHWIPAGMTSKRK